MAWETRPWRLSPDEGVLASARRAAIGGQRVRLTLDPRSWEADDANDLRVEGTVMACTSNGPTLILEEGGRFALIDVLVIEDVDA